MGRNTPRLYDRLYLNDGSGLFRKGNLPLFYGNKSIAVPADVDRDGDMDLFVGGRVIAAKYGETPLSYFLVNDGKARFSVQTTSICPELEKIGMVTGAVWTDINKDGWVDLTVVGEWMPVSIFINEKGHLKNKTREFGLEKFTGLWTSLKMADVNGDGHEDLLVGNWGENSKLHASSKYPLIMYGGDLDNNSYAEQILATEKRGRYFPFLGKDELQRIIPGIIRKKYPDYKSFAGQTVEEVFTGKLDHLKKFSAATLSTMVLVYNKGKYQPIQLPETLQWAPVFSWLTGDFDRDGLCDIIAGGNFKNVQPYEGSYDAGYGTVLMGKGNHVFSTVDMMRSGIDIKGEIRDMKSIKMAGGKMVFAVATNSGPIHFFQLNK